MYNCLFIATSFILAHLDANHRVRTTGTNCGFSSISCVPYHSKVVNHTKNFFFFLKCTYNVSVEQRQFVVDKRLEFSEISVTFYLQCKII
jgi:hypothetical protein